MLSFLMKNQEIGHYSGYKTQVFAEYFFELTSESDLEKLSEAYRFAQEQSLPLLIISGGTNILFAVDRFPGIVIKNSLSGWEYTPENKHLRAFSDAKIWEIAQTLEDDFLQPLWHRFIGLPGSVGGAVYGNAGCF